MAVCERLGIPSPDRMHESPWHMTSRDLAEWIGYMEFQRDPEKYQRLGSAQSPEMMRQVLRSAIAVAEAGRNGKRS